ncbi:DUF3237 domain-containing protein [Rhodoligotrophos defluvii]|uniref:DUF3237 domain-containing protein n=1 Tax=Rhodoligotrophos defluvii TaxID=2561934 RepID=UPI0010C9C6BE|nr:DUF3237 domain-containing protein [Rhodoligotrophos defluvii]
MDPIQTEFLFEMRIGVNAPLSVGKTEAGERRFTVITGGRFEGPRLKGEILPGGADSIFIEPDGMTKIDVRGVLRTDDGALIYMQYIGRRHGPAEVMARLARGENVDPSEYYFRTALTFETGDRRYAWLNGVVAVATGNRPPQGPTYKVYRLL